VYTSANKALAPLASGGSLFLVTVRPDQVLWLVAVLDAPKHGKGAWRAAPNATPIRDITGLIGSIRFKGGKGLVRDAKLAMSLQTPRELDPEVVPRLRAAPAPAAVAPHRRTASSSVSAVAPAASAAASTVERPAGVPSAATWHAVAEHWEHGTRDDQGCRQGAFQYWRADGTKLCETEFREDEPDGMNRRFHPDGSVASEGTWRAGTLYDTVHFASQGPSDELFAPEGRQTPSIVRVEYRCSDGRTNATIRFYDANDREIDRTGVEVPPRPAGVPDTARYFSDENFRVPDGSLGGWCDGRIERGTGDKVGTWRWWSTAGEHVRTEQYDESGHECWTRHTGEDDPVAALVARLIAGEEVSFDVSRAWTPELHALVRGKLAEVSVAVTHEYIDALEDRRVDALARVIEIVEDWERRGTREEPVPTWYMLGVGVRAAYRLGDRKRGAAWWARMNAIALPKKLPAGPWHPLLGWLDKHREQLATWLVPDPAKAAAKLRATLEKSATDDQLVQLLQLEHGVTEGEVWIRDAAQAWLRSPDGRTWHFDGKKLVPATLETFERKDHDLRFIGYADVCDERLMLWPGKHGWISLQRYGRYVMWHRGSYEPSRDQAEAFRTRWLKARSPHEASRFMQRISAARAKATRMIDPWFDNKVGIIVRKYSGKATSLGVHGDKLVKATIRELRVLEQLASHEEAVAAAEHIELEYMRSGWVLERLVAIQPT